MDVDNSAVQQQEAALYARLLHWGTVIGFILLVLSFAAYLTGLLPSFVPPDQLAAYWGEPVNEYLKHTHSPTGWGWLPLAGHGDFSNLIGIVVLSGCSIPPLVALVALFLRRGDRAYAVICLLELLVLLLAASGLIHSGH